MDRFVHNCTIEKRTPIQICISCNIALTFQNIKLQKIEKQID